MEVYGKYFFGNEISDYGQKNGYVDYRTFAKSFDGVMANDFMAQTSEIGYWEPENDGSYYEDINGNIYDSDERDDKLEELEERQSELEEKIADLEDRIFELDDETALYHSLTNDLDKANDELGEVEANIDALQDCNYPEVFQWFIIDSNGADICKEANEIVYYNEVLDLYLWGVTHWGTSWDYVLTNIRCNTAEDREVA